MRTAEGYSGPRYRATEAADDSPHSDVPADRRNLQAMLDSLAKKAVELRILLGNACAQIHGPEPKPTNGAQPTPPTSLLSVAGAAESELIDALELAGRIVATVGG